MKKGIYSLAIAMVMLTFSCRNNTNKENSSITGNWKVDTASRGGRPTSLLNGVYFSFGQDGKMRTNLPGSPDTFIGYELKAEQIFQKSGDTICYKIKTLTDSTLVLGFEAQNTPFELHLKRTPDLNIPAQQPDSLPQ